MKRLFHVTPGCNRASILRYGIDPRHSLTKRAEVWLVRGSKLQWAMEHVAQRHACDIHECLAIEVFVPEAKNRGQGRFTVDHKIRVDASTATLDFGEVFSEALFRPGEFDYP